MSSGPPWGAGTPFPFEGPVPPGLLIGRETELARLARRAGDRVNVRLVGPRRYGKTSLLLAHAAQLRKVGWRSAHVDLSGVADVTDVARRVASAYAAIDSEWLRGQLSGLLTRLGISISPAGPAVSLGRAPRGEPHIAEQALEPLLDLPLRLFERDEVPTLVVFDEFQELLGARDDLDGLLRSHLQYHGDAAAYVFAGSEPSMMRQLFETRERPFFGQADPLTLGPLPTDETISALAARFAAESVVPGPGLGELIVFAEGHPQRTMLLMYLLADLLSDGEEASPALTALVIDQALERTRAAHEALWQQLTAPERAVLAAVADGEGPTGRSLAERHRVSRGTLDNAARRLADQGHLNRSSQPRGTRLIDPLLAEWIRRR